MGNDFALFKGKTFITFPPFPALLMLPFVALSGSPENFRDGQFIVWLAGLGPAFLFLVLEKLRRPNARAVALRTARSASTSGWRSSSRSARSTSSPPRRGRFGSRRTSSVQRSSPSTSSSLSMRRAHFSAASFWRAISRRDPRCSSPPRSSRSRRSASTRRTRCLRTGRRSRVELASARRGRTSTSRRSRARTCSSRSPSSRSSGSSRG